MSNLKPIIEDSFIQYTGAVLQSRALVDVRDGLKPSARQIFYSMLQRKLTHDKPYKKTANAVGMAMADSLKSKVMLAHLLNLVTGPQADIQRVDFQKYQTFSSQILTKTQLQNGEIVTTIQNNILRFFQLKAITIFVTARWELVLEWLLLFRSIICVK